MAVTQPTTEKSQKEKTRLLVQTGINRRKLLARTNEHAYRICYSSKIDTKHHREIQK